MIIGFGFGSPLTALLMLIITGFLSYAFFKMLRKSQQRYPRERYPVEKPEELEILKERRRAYYYEQRRAAKELMEKYDLTDEEIDRKVEEEFQ